MARPLRTALSRRAGLWLGALGAVLAMIAARAQAFHDLEYRAQSALLAARAPNWNPQVVLLAVDNATTRRLSWPLPRARYAELVTAVHQAGAKALGIDLFFNSRGIDSPAGDEALAAAIRAAGQTTVALPCIGQAPDEPGPLHDALAPGAVPPGATPALHCPGAMPPYGPLAHAGPLSVVEMRSGAGAGYRGPALFADVAGVRLPTLALRVASLGEGKPIMEEPRRARVGAAEVPCDASGNALASVRKWSPEAVSVSVADAIASLQPGDTPRFAPEMAARFRGKYVILAATAGFLKDVGQTTDGELVPLAVFHAALLQDLLEGHPVRELPPPVAPLSAAVLAALMIAAVLRTRPAVAAASLAVVVFGIVGAALLGVSAGVVASPVEPAVACALAFLGALAGRLVTEGRERALLREAFGSYVDPGVMERILASPEQYLALGGARRELTVLFSDIQGYTGLSNQLPPEEVMELLREYLEVMTNLVRAHRGRVDKIMGDGIMAVFGDPVPDPEHAASAVAVAVKMQREMARLTERWSAAGKARLAIRIGVATGEVFVGNIGSRGAKIEYTVLGPPVNLASRLEGKAPAGGVLVSERTREACGERFAFDRVDGLTLKGYAEGQVAFVARARAGGAS